MTKQLSHIELLLNSAWRRISWIESESHVTTDGQPASLSWNKAPICGLRPDLYYLCDSCRFVDLGRPLWREDGSVVYSCCWPSPAQSFLGASPVGLVAILYCLRFETSRFVSSYDSQGHGGGIRPRLHMSDLLNSWINSIFYLPRGPNISHHVEQLIVLCYSVCCHGNVFFNIRCHGNRCLRAVA
jgi:hypothetical protein